MLLNNAEVIIPNILVQKGTVDRVLDNQEIEHYMKKEAQELRNAWRSEDTELVRKLVREHVLTDRLNVSKLGSACKEYIISVGLEERKTNRPGGKESLSQLMPMVLKQDPRLFRKIRLAERRGQTAFANTVCFYSYDFIWGKNGFMEKTANPWRQFNYLTISLHMGVKNFLRRDRTLSSRPSPEILLAMGKYGRDVADAVTHLARSLYMLVHRKHAPSFEMKSYDESVAGEYDKEFDTFVICEFKELFSSIHKVCDDILHKEILYRKEGMPRPPWVVQCLEGSKDTQADFVLPNTHEVNLIAMAVDDMLANAGVDVEGSNSHVSAAGWLDKVLDLATFIIDSHTPEPEAEVRRPAAAALLSSLQHFEGNALPTLKSLAAEIASRAGLQQPDFTHVESAMRSRVESLAEEVGAQVVAAEAEAVALAGNDVEGEAGLVVEVSTEGAIEQATNVESEGGPSVEPSNIEVEGAIEQAAGGLAAGVNVEGDAGMELSNVGTEGEEHMEVSSSEQPQGSTQGLDVLVAAMFSDASQWKRRGGKL